MTAVWRRILLWIAMAPVAVLLSILAVASRAPDAPWQLVAVFAVFIWLFLGSLFDHLLRSQAEAFDAIVRGDLTKCRALLDRRRAGGLFGRLDTLGTAGLEVTLLEIAMARARLAREPVKLGPAARTKRVVLAHAALVEGGTPAAPLVLSQLLDITPLRFAEAEQYRLFVVALASLFTLRLGEPRGEIALSLDRASLLLASRASGKLVSLWLSAERDIDEPSLLESSTELRASAALARAHALYSLGDRLDARASSLERALLVKAPYRR